MKHAARSVAWLLPCLLTACFHRTHPSQLQPYAPPASSVPKPSANPVDLPISATTLPTQPVATNTEVALPPKPTKHKKSGNKNAQQAVNNPAPPANESPGVSAIGQLSSGDPTDTKRETVESLSAIERGLNGINRQLSESEQKTAVQIREYLKQAKAALDTGDVDGAHTLASKAKVLLSELSQ
jgi:hypothetical protein